MATSAKPLPPPPVNLNTPGVMPGWMEDVVRAINVKGAAVADVTMLTTETAGATYGANERSMLNKLKADVTALTAAVNGLLAELRSIKTISE